MCTYSSCLVDVSLPSPADILLLCSGEEMTGAEHVILSSGDNDDNSGHRDDKAHWYPGQLKYSM